MTVSGILARRSAGPGDKASPSCFRGRREENAMNKKVISAILLLLFAEMVKNSFVPVGAIGGIVANAIPLGSIVGAGALLWSAARQSLTQAIVDAIAERFPRPQ
jgi:hypothetical protein